MISSLVALIKAKMLYIGIGIGLLLVGSLVVWHFQQIKKAENARDEYWKNQYANAPENLTGTTSTSSFVPLPATNQTTRGEAKFTDTAKYIRIIDSLNNFIGSNQVRKDSVVQDLIVPRTASLVKLDSTKKDTIAVVNVKYDPWPNHLFSIGLMMTMRIDTVKEHYVKPILAPGPSQFSRIVQATEYGAIGLGVAGGIKQDKTIAISAGAIILITEIIKLF